MESWALALNLISASETFSSAQFRGNQELLENFNQQPTAQSSSSPEYKRPTANSGLGHSEAALEQHRQDEDDLSSERFGANYYAQLRDLLAAKDWKAADKETADRMCEVMDRQWRGFSREPRGWLRMEDIKGFPCKDLSNINRLWLKYSQGRFGFSVQREIWQSCGSPRYWENFGENVGWKDPNGWLDWNSWYVYSKYSFLLSAPKGHLPSPFIGVRWRKIVGEKNLDAREGVRWVSSLVSRLVECNIQ